MKKPFIFSLLIAVLLSLQATAQHQVKQSFGQNQVVNPYALQVSFSKTVHIIFPHSIKYVDLGSRDIIADKADGVENILRVKANSKGFKETSLSVVTGDGKYYSYLVTYTEEPAVLNINMSGTASGSTTLSPAPAQGIPAAAPTKAVFNEYRLNEADMAAYSKSIIKANHGSVNKHKANSMVLRLKGIYIRDNVVFYCLDLANRSRIGYDIDFVKFIVKDKKVLKQTAIQEAEVTPLYTYSEGSTVKGKRHAHQVFALEKFTIPDDKVLEIQVFEKRGGRHLKIVVENDEIIRAKQFTGNMVASN